MLICVAQFVFQAGFSVALYIKRSGFLFALIHKAGRSVVSCEFIGSGQCLLARKPKADAAGSLKSEVRRHCRVGGWCALRCPDAVLILFRYN